MENNKNPFVETTAGVVRTHIRRSSRVEESEWSKAAADAGGIVQSFELTMSSSTNVEGLVEESEDEVRPVMPAQPVQPRSVASISGSSMARDPPPEGVEVGPSVKGVPYGLIW